MGVITTCEVANRLGISRERVAQLAREGRIPHQWTPLGRLYDENEVERIRVEREKRTGM